MDTICVYKDKLNEALTLVPSMSQAKRLEAVSYWNNAASHFQKMVNANSSTHDLSLHQSDATGQDSSLDLDYQQQANDINPTVILDSEEFSIGQSEQINPPTSDNIVDLTSDLSPSDTLASQFQQQQTSSDAPLYDSEYFSSNMMGEMQQQLSPDHDEINHLSANDTLQRAYMNDVLATENNCAQTGSLAAVNTCPGNQYQPAHHTGDIALNNIVPGTSSCSNLDGMNPDDTQVPIDSSVFCPMPNSSIQMTSMRNTGVENSNVICQSSVLPQANHTVRNPNVSNDLVLCPRQPTSTHDIGNGQFDRGPGHPPRQQVQVCQSTSTINMDPCFSMSTSIANMNRNDLFTQGVRPLQQIQISEQSQIESDYNVDARPRTTFFQQNQPCPDISNANQQQLVYLPPTNLATQPPPCTSTRFNILPQQSEVGVKMESMNYIEVCATTSNEQHTCELCGKSGFSTKGNLKRHRKAHAGEKPYQCEHCDSKFTEKKSLKIHLRRHTGEKPYKCTVCEKPFSQTGVLKSHMALHLEERKFNCDKCNKAFRQRSQLKLHLMRHDGIKKLECSRCMAKFLTKGDLERHFRIHTGERPYKCNMCEKTFTRQQSLNEHKNRHIGRKPFTCKYCDKSFSEMSASYKHAKVHKKEEQARAIDRVDP